MTTSSDSAINDSNLSSENMPDNIAQNFSTFSPTQGQSLGQSLNISLPKSFAPGMPGTNEQIDIDEFNQSIVTQNVFQRKRNIKTHQYFRDYRATRKTQQDSVKLHFSEVMSRRSTWLGSSRYRVHPEVIQAKLAEHEFIEISDPLQLIWEKRTYRSRVFVTPEEWATESGRYLAKERADLYGLRFKYARLGAIMKSELLDRLGTRRVTLVEPTHWPDLNRSEVEVSGLYKIEKSAENIKDLEEFYESFAKVCAMLYVFFPRLVRLLRDTDVNPNHSLTLAGHTQSQTVGWFREIREGELKFIFEATNLDDFATGCAKFSELCKTHLMVGDKSLFDFSKALRRQALECTQRLFQSDEYNRDSGRFETVLQMD